MPVVGRGSKLLLRDHRDLTGDHNFAGRRKIVNDLSGQFIRDDSANRYFDDDVLPILAVALEPSPCPGQHGVQAGISGGEEH